MIPCPKEASLPAQREIKEAAIFTKVHQVTYVVESIDQMAEYMEKNFGLKAARTDEIGERGYKSILYHIGPTMVDFFEPTRDDTAMARQLKEQ